MTIVANAIPRQTLPYGDRAFVNLTSGQLTLDAYQYMSRLAQGMVGTVNNVGTIITTTNTILADLTGVQTEITGLQTEINQLQVQIGLIDTSSGTPPALPPVGAVNMATALGIGFFFA